jgi:MoaA/NifB/PqqE/SkfB family radical SAM enzyme
MYMDFKEEDIVLGTSKTFSIADGISIKSRRENDKWGTYDEDWGFRIHDIPSRFRNDKKYENFVLAKKEEAEKKLVLDSKPFNVVIEPTNICNLQCPLCSTGVGAETRQKGVLDFTNFKNFVDQLSDTILLLSLQNWGEPTLVKALPKMIKYASEKNIFVRLSTNFSIKYDEDYLEELISSGLGILVIDLDGTTQEIYEKYRKNGDLDVVISNIKKAVNIKKTKNLQFPILQTRMIVMKHNEHQVDDFFKMSKEFNVDEMEISNVQLNPNIAKKWLPKNKKYVYESYLDVERKVSPCHWPWSGFTINWDGGITPCCIIDDQNSDFGNVLTSSISEIWNNKFYVSARSEFSDTKDITKFTICNMCKNDTHNPNLHRIGDTFSITMNPNTKIRNSENN